MPFVNLRNIAGALVIDRRLASPVASTSAPRTSAADNPPHIVLDTHFRASRPIVEQLTDAFADDWLFTTGEKLLTDHWFPPLEKTAR